MTFYRLVVGSVAIGFCRGMQSPVHTRNLAKSDECKDFCEKIPKDWEEKCAIPPCMGCSECDDIVVKMCAPFCSNVPADKVCSLDPCIDCDGCVDPPTPAPTASPTPSPTPAPTAQPT